MVIGRLENKLAALVSDATRLGVGIGSLEPPAVGQQSLAAAITSIDATPGFVPNETAAVGGAAPPRSRRVLPVQFEATIEVRSRPASADAPARGAARSELAGLVSAIAYRFADPDMQSGKDFHTAEPDPGFRVLSFGLVSAAVPSGLADGSFSGQVLARGRALLWPPGAGDKDDVIDSIERVLVPLPVAMRVPEHGLLPGAAAEIVVELGAFERGAPHPALVIETLADVPLDQRGTIAAAADGPLPGLFIVPATFPETTIRYEAPLGYPGPAGRAESLAIHLATPQGGKGLPLGSATIRLVPLPVTVRVPESGLVPGATAEIVIQLGGFERGGSNPALAIEMIADVPLDQRGAIAAAAAGAEQGLFIVPATLPETTIRYEAPAGSPGPAGRTESLAIHLATAEGGKGPLLGSATIRLVAP
jgi:hypothetical protein